MAEEKEQVKLVLVSGATGYIGSRVVRELLDNGYRVRGTVRDLNKAKGQEHLRAWIEAGEPLELVQANLLDEASWVPAAAGCDLVAHVASPFFVGCSDAEAEEKLFKPAKNGTLNVLKAAKEAGTVKRVVVTSSVAAIQSGHENPPMLEFPEEQWTNMDKADNYSKSKTMAERAAWDYVEKLEEEEGKAPFELATINPSLVVGPPLSNGYATSHAIPKRFLNHEMPAVPALHFGTVDVRDVARAHRLALEVPAAAGNRFVLQGQSTSMIEWARILAPEFQPLGYKVPTRKLPYFIMWMLSLFDKEIKATLPEVGKGPRDMSNKKARDVLGLEFTPEATSLKDHCHACLELGVEGFRQTPKYKAYLASKST